ncbi:MAG: 60S ribosomal protein L32 [Amphiamblys sp. WSBS2006]|nr:MAG: 60S ribosomal protein L32 [Amphiamblys sp. WSBS2006]
MENKKVTLKKIKKRTKSFVRHHSDRYNRVKKAWRKPKGIDNCVRRKFSGAIPMPGKGYKTDKRTRYLLKNGTYKFPVSNTKDLSSLLMHNKSHSAEIAHGVSARNRIKIIEKAKELGVCVINASARVVTADASE